VPSVAANGLTLEYESLGDPANPPLLLVMGLGANMRLWPPGLCDKLVAAGFHVIRFDNRDAGRSTQLDHLGVPNIAKEAIKFFLRMKVRAKYSLDDMARDTAALIDALGLVKPHVVGASMGGMIAQNLAALFPQKVGTLTSIMSTTGWRKLPGPEARARKALLAKPPPPGDYEAAVRRLMSLLRTIGSRTYPAPEDELRALCESHVRQGNNPMAAARQLVAIAAAADRSAVVKSIKVPTLVIHGDEDPLLRPPCGAHTAKMIREGGGNVKHVVVQGMGHDFPAELRDEIVAHIAAHAKQFHPESN
jgi:pimeloyl-ACP methyl ester carboxylesterase